uniref:BTB domain-containing protein n=1 Tax=Panagrolaimus superbus TaxID=310955 RepID=A0A914YC97_9BILA
MECEIGTDWSIDEKALLEVKKDGYLESPRMQTTIPGVEFYYIRIEGSNPFKFFNNATFDLFVKTDTPLRARCTFSVPSANFSKTFTYDYDDDKKNGHAFSLNFIERKSFFEAKNKYFQNGKLTLQLRGTFKLHIIDETEQDTLSHILWKRDDKDFTIQTEDKDIRAHKFVLRVRSPVFAAMFDSGMKEAEESKVKIEGFSYKVVKAAIEFCYDVKNGCNYCSAYVIQHLVKKLSPDKVCSIANASIETNADKLRLCCMNYLIKSLKDSITVTEVDSLDIDFKSELVNKAFRHRT